MFHVFLHFPEWKKKTLKYFDVENECVDEEQMRSDEKKIKGKSLSPKTPS